MPPARPRSRRLAPARAAALVRALRRGAGALLLPAAIRAQDGGGGAAARGGTLGAMATGVVTRAAPALLGVSRTEGYLTQPAVQGALARGLWQGVATLNLEGLTLMRGELTPGSYGEGYVDRRHPHTLVHEAMLGAATPAAGRWRASLAAGKGFVPFGTDDPMMRPFVKFPVNHHHAQLPERVQGVLAVQWRGAAPRAAGSARGPVVTLERGWFNGDEPTGPWARPQWRRTGDSHATRLTAQLARAGGAWELQGSRAFVRSPGIIQGGAFDHRQGSVSVRWARTGAGHGGHGASPHDGEGAGHPGGGDGGGLQYLLVEAARTDEGTDGVRAFRYESLLAEALWRRGGWTVAVRGERTDRPEPERLLDLYRTPTGHIDFQIVGITRFDVATAQLSLPSARRARWGAVAPFIEVAAARPAARGAGGGGGGRLRGGAGGPGARRRPAVFDPPAFYGARTLWTLSAGVRLHAGTMRARMGRYGVLAP